MEQSKERIRSIWCEAVSHNYKEDPVDVIQFIEDPEYLGNSTSRGADIYKVWKLALIDMFCDNSKTLVVLTGAIGTGKSTIALIALAYIQYRLMILRDPWGEFNLADSGRMTISFFNLNKTLGDSRGYTKLQNFMIKSPWFRRNAAYIQKTNLGEEFEYSLIKYNLASPYSKGFGIVGEDVVAGILDEVDSPIDSIKQKQRIIATYDSTVLRFKSRFAASGYSLGKLFIVSSKQDELSFIDTFVASRKSSSEVIVFDIPLWEAKPKNMFSGVKFPVAVGDAYNPPKIIEDSERESYVNSGFQIINIPVEFKIDFQLNLIGSLRDIAGITVAGARKSKLFSSERFILQCFDEEKKDPVKVPVIRVGLDDETEFIWYLDLTLLRVPKSVPRFVHLDISFSGDASGIAMSCVKDWKHMIVTKEDGTFVNELSPIIETDFVMRIKAKDGDRIPIHKMRKFILDLRAAGVNVYLFSADLRLASEDTLQLLTKAGIRAEYFSVDKTSQPYIDFRNMAYEKRWVCHKHNMLFFELKHLEQSILDGKIDHPKEVKDVEFLSDGGIKEVVMEGSKDLADAVAGSVSQCLLNSKMPVDMTIMKDLMSKTASKERAIVQQDEIENLFTMKDHEGNKIVAVKQPDGITKVTEIIKRLHGR
jgi:hypothetical protein